jgi:release factor glutamine methyltransferase
MPTTAFHNVSLLVAPGQVMSPRHATERLVDRALELVGHDRMRVADVGTGCGAIAVTLALLAPRAEIWATDISEPAVSLARTNAARQDVSRRADPRQSRPRGRQPSVPPGEPARGRAICGTR